PHVTVNVASAQPTTKGPLSIPIRLAKGTGDTSSLALTSEAEGFEIQLADCLSGYTAAVSEAHTDGLEVYRHDRGCLAKLSQFTFSGTTYYPTASDPLSTWQVGDSALFDEFGEPGTSPLRVVV